MCRVDDGIFSTSRNAFSMGSCCGRKSRAWRRCKIDCWKCPYALKISPNVKYCRQAFRSGDWTSNERRVKWMASSKYCKLNSTLARLCSISELDGEIDSARRKHSIDLVASPLIRQKFPIWLYSWTVIGFSRFAFFNRFSNTSMLKFFKLFDCLFLRNWNATWEKAFVIILCSCSSKIADLLRVLARLGGWSVERYQLSHHKTWS